MFVIDDGQYSFRATTNKAMPLLTTLPAFFFRVVSLLFNVSDVLSNDVGDATEWLCGMSCDVGKALEGLDNEL